jgi:hypothetical protein
VTATAGITAGGKRTWLIESTSPHAAGCLQWDSNAWVWDGVQRTVPLRITIAAR